MANVRDDEWNSSREIYSPSEVESVLRALGIEVKEETGNDFVSLCPYHGNSDTPAFSTSKRYGFSVCFNPSCAVGTEYQLTLERLVRDLRSLSRVACKRFVNTHKGASGESFEDKFDAIHSEPEEMAEFHSDVIERMHERFMGHGPAKEYMVGRGFEKKTMEHFKVGFTPSATGYGVPVYRAHDMIVVPSYDQKNRPIGLVGRSIVGKEFKNYGAALGGKGFHKSHIVWNLQNARRYETIILTESTFDSMRIHQAGYPNVGALLGGSLSRTQTEILNRHFSHVIIFTDDENKQNGEMNFPVNCLRCLKSGNDICQGHRPGRDLGMKIAEGLPRLKVSWATYDDNQVYANHVKDAAAMTDSEIRQALRNAISHYEYLDWVA